MLMQLEEDQDKEAERKESACVRVFIHICSRFFYFLNLCVCVSIVSNISLSPRCCRRPASRSYFEGFTSCASVAHRARLDGPVSSGPLPLRLVAAAAAAAALSEGKVNVNRAAGGKESRAAEERSGGSRENFFISSAGGKQSAAAAGWRFSFFFFFVSLLNTHAYSSFILFIFAPLRGGNRGGADCGTMPAEVKQVSVAPGLPRIPPPASLLPFQSIVFEMVCIDGRVHFKFQPLVNITIRFHVASARPQSRAREREREIYRRPSGEREVFWYRGSEWMGARVRACTREGAVFVHVCDECVRAVCCCMN